MFKLICLECGSTSVYDKKNYDDFYPMLDVRRMNISVEGERDCTGASEIRCNNCDNSVYLYH